MALAYHLDMSRSTVEPRNAQLMDHIDARPKGLAVAMVDPPGKEHMKGSRVGD